MLESLQTNTTIAHYRIISKLGAGGMGEVYLAQDTKLDRKVALKVLPADVASHQDRMERFIREAKSAAALNHPNIAHIHEIGEHDGIHFIVMEFVDGVTLREKIHRDRVPLSKLLKYLIQVAEGLSKAHAAGIVHRDLKPDNIMITRDDYAKILDFGLAKLVEPQRTFESGQVGSSEIATAIMQHQSIPGTVVGTIGYMSPEQASGRVNEIDHRSDIFSFGCILFEAATGQRAFEGKDALDSLHKIVHAPTPQLKDVNPLAPDELQRVVRRCLAKEPEKRYQSMKEVALEIDDLQQELKGLTGSEYSGRPASPTTVTTSGTQNISGAAPAKSVAVLPFVNMSADAENEFFCDGLAEELLNALAKIDELKVAARTSAFSFKGKNRNVSEIGDALHVKTVLEGSVRKSGNRLRITAQLVNASDGYHLWSERYDREMKDIFDVQDEITLAVVEALKVKLFGEEQAAILKRHTTNAEAHEFYLRGLSYFGRFTPEGFQKAIESFKRAIAIDAGYASAHAGLADAYTEMSFFSFAPSEWMPKAREAAMRAVELDDALGEAHNSLAIIKVYYDWDYTGAEREYRRALDLDPGSVRIHMWYGWYLGLMGRFDEGLKQLQHAWELDPLSDPINLGIGIIFHWSRQPERAIEQFRKMLELNPNYPVAYSFLAEAYEQKGDFVSAIATVKRLQQAANDPLTLSTVGYVYAKSGDHAKALQILNELEKRSNQEYVTALHFAQIYAGLGDNEQALAWLDKACTERSVWMTFVRVDPKFDPLRDDPRFKDLLKRMNLSE